MTNQYILVCDERGTRNWPSSSSTWAFGGYITNTSSLNKLLEIWGKIKIELCGQENVELKWSHFFPGTHQNGDNPLLVSNPDERRNLLLWGLGQLCSIDIFTPITVVCRKNRIKNSNYDTYFEKSKKGTLLLRDQLLKTGVIALFALYLNEVKGIGELWYDKLGSRQEEFRVQNSWDSTLSSEQYKKNFPEHHQMLQRINSKIKFLDSSKETSVQLADFLSGVIWAASEGDEEFLTRYESTYAYSPILKKATLIKVP